MPASETRSPDASTDGPAPSALPPTIGPLTLPDDRDGSRLKVRWLRPEDGAPAPNGILDTMLEASCSWVHYEGGKYRCLPAHTQAYLYSDPDCTRPLLVRAPDPCVPPPDYVTVVPAQLSCPASTVVRRRGARVQRTDAFEWGPSGCEVRPIDPRVEVYEVGEFVPAETFAGATRRIEPLTEGWSRVYLEADDGSRWLSSLRRGETDCRINTAADGVLRCLPVANGALSLGLVEADCSTGAALGARSSCAAEDILVWDLRSLGCAARIPVRRATRRLNVGYVPLNDTCDPLLDPNYEAFAVGEELSPGDFPEAIRGILDGPGRLLRYATQTSAGVHGIASYWDSELAAPCSLVADGVGSYRCVPDVAFRPTVFFADPWCRRPIVRHEPCRLIRYVAKLEPNACPLEYRIFHLGHVIPVETPRQLDGDLCVPATVPAGTIFRELGEEAYLFEFVQVRPSP
jgi:hypothetical protein